MKKLKEKIEEIEKLKKQYEIQNEKMKNVNKKELENELKKEFENELEIMKKFDDQVRMNDMKNDFSKISSLKTIPGMLELKSIENKIIRKKFDFIIGNYETFPILYDLVISLKFLIPSTTTCERKFSHMNNILFTQRFNLNPETLESIMKIKFCGDDELKEIIKKLLYPDDETKQLLKELKKKLFKIKDKKMEEDIDNDEIQEDVDDDEIDDDEIQEDVDDDKMSEDEIQEDLDDYYCPYYEF